MLENEVAAIFHHVLSANRNFNTKQNQNWFLTFLSRKSSKVNNISKSHRDFPKVVTDEPNGRQTVSTKILPNASTKQEKFV